MGTYRTQAGLYLGLVEPSTGELAVAGRPAANRSLTEQAQHGNKPDGLQQENQGYRRLPVTTAGMSEQAEGHRKHHQDKGNRTIRSLLIAPPQKLSPGTSKRNNGTLVPLPTRESQNWASERADPAVLDGHSPPCPSFRLPGSGWSGCRPGVRFRPAP